MGQGDLKDSFTPVCHAVLVIPLTNIPIPNLISVTVKRKTFSIELRPYITLVTLKYLDQFNWKLRPYVICFNPKRSMKARHPMITIPNWKNVYSHMVRVWHAWSVDHGMRSKHPYRKCAAPVYFSCIQGLECIRGASTKRLVIHLT